MKADLSDEKLAKWAALCEAATPGPWSVEPDGECPVLVAAVAPGARVFADPPGGSYPYNDRLLIAEQRTAMPALLAEVERLKRSLAESGTLIDVLKHQLDELGSQINP
ncbi:hypothetical protein LCGC14_1703600 [marine sediment metagenome]|uniref:Uncharacterized protein n=1 Tax=marine sediment metagenome TaxID=412755 RepID=A0A0F9JXS5_9ZZZZ